MSKNSAPVQTEFDLTTIGRLSTTVKGNLYLPCETDLGRVAFWGTKANRRNIDAIKSLPLPSRLRCGCIPSNWSQHVFWIPQGAEVVPLQMGTHKSAPTAQIRVVDSPNVSADDLALWRRRLLRLLDRIEAGVPSAEGPVARITILKRSGRIPRDTAALMIALAELRNASEHQGKKPSTAEAAVARNAWLAICEWATGQGIDAEHL